MDLPRRRQEAWIEMTWISCRGVKSPIPFHTQPSLYATISLVSSQSDPHRRPHRVQTPTDRDSGENPEWDHPIRLYLPSVSMPASASHSDLLLRFDIKAEVAVLGDVHVAAAAVPVAGLDAGTTGKPQRVSYQLRAPDGTRTNGVISFSYVLQTNAATVYPPSEHPAAVSSLSDASAPGIYPSLQEPATVYPPLEDPAAASSTSDGSKPGMYPPLQELATIYPPLEDPAAASSTSDGSKPGMYPPLQELATVYPPLEYPAGVSSTSNVSEPGVCPPLQGLATVYPPLEQPANSYYRPPVTTAAAEPVSVYPPLPDEEVSYYAPPELPVGGIYPPVHPSGCHYTPLPRGACSGYPAAGPEWDRRCLYS